MKPTVSTADEVAALAGICKKSVRRLELRGYLVRVRGFSRPALYSRVSVDRWLSGQAAAV
jgi:hypothetical protein